MKKLNWRTVRSIAIDFAGISLILGIISWFVSPRPVWEVLLMSAGIVIGEQLLDIAYRAYRKRRMRHGKEAG